MKKLLLIIALLAALLLSSCSMLENLGGAQNGGGNGAGTGNGNGTSQGGNNSDKPLIWNLETEVYFISDVTGTKRQAISDKFTELTGNTLSPHSDSKEQKPHELVVGPSTRPISQAAYHLLDRNMTDDDDPEGYVILVQDGSVAVAYSSDASYAYAMESFYRCCGFTDYYAENGPVFWDFYSLSARAEQNRDKMRDEAFEEYKQKLVNAGADNADAIVRSIKTYYTLVSSDIIYWITDLYDPETGAFYHNASSRDNFGFLPDLESTLQSLYMLDRGGLFSSVLGHTLESGNIFLPDSFTEPLVEWMRGLQDPETGFFYHPQWGKDATGASRRGRDLDNAVALFTKVTHARPYYDDPSGRMKGTLGAPGENAVKPASALSSRLGTSAIKAVSAITPAASVLPSYLRTLDAWAAHLEAVNINGDGRSYGQGNALVAEWSVIKAAGPEYVDMLFDYLDSHQYEDIGLWEYQNEEDYDPDDKVGYNGTNGLMKICVLYGSLGRAVPNAYNALKSAIKVGLYPNTDPRDETICYSFNIWTCISSMMGNIKSRDPDNYPAAQKLLADNILGLLEASYDLQHSHLQDDGGFSNYERRSMNGSGEFLVGCSNGPESDTDATMVATTSTIGTMFNSVNYAFGISGSVPLWCADDYYIFMNELESKGPVYKKEIPQAELITFDDYVEGDVVDGNELLPHDDLNVKIGSHTYFSSTVVQRPGTTLAESNLALRLESLVETEYNSAKAAHYPIKDENGKELVAPGPTNAYASIGNTYGTGDCYTLEADIRFDDADIGALLELWVQNTRLGSNYNFTGFLFTSYKSGNDMYVKFSDAYAGADKAQNQNIYDKIKVGEWFNLKLEIYKIYVENADETLTLEVKIKVFIDGLYITETDCANIVNDKVNDIEPDKFMFSQYRHRGSTIYLDNVKAERKDAKYEKEIVRNEVTFDNGAILSSPAINVNLGTASEGLINDEIVKGETEGGNDRNYFKIRDDVAGKVDDAVLEVYHAADGKNSGYGVSNVNIGITDGSSRGQVFILDFEMMLEEAPTSTYFTRLKIGSTGNTGLYHDFKTNGADVIVQNFVNGKNQDVTLGAVGEWIRVKMIWHAINPSNIDLTQPGAPTVEFYFIVYDAEGNENLLMNATLYTSHVASNKALNNIYFIGSDNATGEDQRYFLDNITFIRTTDTSVIPEVPAAE